MMVNRIEQDSRHAFALLRISQTSEDGSPKPLVARRMPGETAGGGQLHFKPSPILPNADAPLQLQQAALTQALRWIDGDLPDDFQCRINYFHQHRALLEFERGVIALDVRDLPPDAIGAMALAWVAALHMAAGGAAGSALAMVARCYRALPMLEQREILQFLADGRYDPSFLFASYLHRVQSLTADEDVERGANWFLGQSAIDLPYDRREVAALLAADIDPDERRLALASAVRTFDAELEAGNIQRIVAATHGAGEEVIFGRMSRAFHNQGLLFANAGYLQVDETIRTRLTDLRRTTLGHGKLAPAADRLYASLHGVREAALTGALGALELLENAVIDDQRQRLDALLQAERDERVLVESDSPSAILAESEGLLAQCRALRIALRSAPRRAAAYVIFSQRFSNTGSHLFARINECQEPYLGKADNLKMLVRKGNHRLYASPDYRWLHHADHWIEAIPLFIKERVLIVDGVEVTETVIDQQAMEESFREELAEHWAENINGVMASEYVALAREVLGDEADAQAIGERAAWIAACYRAHAVEIHRHAEHARVSRFDALRYWLHNATDGDERVEHDAVFLADAAELAKIALLPRRPLPALHVLTTQSARMSDGYVRTWLEESMALYNVCRAYHLLDAVDEKMTDFRVMITAIGTRLMHELGMWTEVEDLIARERVSETRAIGRIIAGNAAIGRQLSIIAVLAEHFGISVHEDPAAVDTLLRTQLEALQQRAALDVFARNEFELLPRVDDYREQHAGVSEDDAARALIFGNSEYADDLAAFTRFAAREAVIETLDREDETLALAARVGEWMRNHTRLAKTTARRMALLEAGLNHLTLHPLYYYRATGGNKRFHQLYTPSRVDLGSRERESVETWAQWVGGADSEAARVGRRLYGLINKNVKMFDSLTEPEVLKTGENASMVSHFSYANAMSLLVNSVGRGDVEDLGDQMSLRKDRLIHPGGEGYGGYCVPKDGLFLEFVLILTRATKLRQLGIPDHLHAGVVALAHRLLEQRDEFSGELEWEEWAMSLIAQRGELSGYFSLRPGEDNALPLFHITRIAQALTRLGRPELTDSFDVLANLAARWSIHKIIVGGEHVNRFMPFYKTWLSYRAVEEAAQFNPALPSRLNDFTVVLTGEYKPDTQDGRFSVGMRKFEIYAGSGDHLKYSLDVPAQDLVHLMFEGFARLHAQRDDPRLCPRYRRLLHELQVRDDDARALERLCALFPGYSPPGEIRLVSPMGLATSDLLHYTSDTNLEALAGDAQRRLLDAGLSEQEISANMHVYGPRLTRWARLRSWPAAQQAALMARIGGAIHALALKILGPIGAYEMALQGADVLDTGIPHRELVALLSNPVKVRDLMLEGNPHSALVIIDGASGARRRAMNRLAVMRWFAAGDAIGRQSLYRAIGLGAETIESWREEMHRQRERAELLYQAVCRGEQQQAEVVYADIVALARDGQEAMLALEEEERLLRFQKLTPQEAAVARALSDIAAGLPLAQLELSHWLALGGQFLVIGYAREQFDDLRARYAQGLSALSGQATAVNEQAVQLLFSPAYVPAAKSFSEEKGIESSNKATEEVAAVAIDTRKHLAERAARARAMHEREQAFLHELQQCASLPMQALLKRAHTLRGDGDGISQAQFGGLQALTRLALLAFGREIFSPGSERWYALEEHAQALYTGRDLDEMAARAISGGYEDTGDLARLGQQFSEDFAAGILDEVERDRRLHALADVAELTDCCRAIALTIDFYVVEPAEQQAWQKLAEFFAESINDHRYACRPWAYSRGTAFSHLSGDSLYALAVAHHQWLYRYLRGVMQRFTELREMPPHYCREVVGDMTDAAQHSAIGAGAGTPPERCWRAYNQLREISFLRNDGFPLPELFEIFDPAIIRADERVNLAFLLPVGRTHVSRALMEGPMLSHEREVLGRPGVNLLITRDVELAELASLRRQAAFAHDAHLYISREEFEAALQRHRGFSAEQAEKLAAEKVGPKGVRIAARFTQPVLLALIFPMHGHPKYQQGNLEDIGLPYSSQSLFHTWTTYDKAKYPAIFSPETGVDIPGEIDWLSAYTADLGEEASYRALEHGDATRQFSGLRHFANSYPLILVKDAAESGGRGQKAFALRGQDNVLDETVLEEAVAFIYQISLKHNVAIQEVIISSPEYWATEKFLQTFVDRQVQEWGAVVNRTRRPYTSIYGSHRLIFSSPDPRSGNWHVSHPITLNSRQLITNVGRGGTLDLFHQDIIRPEYRERLWQRMVESGTKCMEALARYGEVAGDAYRKETGREIGTDLTGLSYAVPRYMMLDFLVQPVFAEEGIFVDLEPYYDESGVRCGAHFVLQHGEERRYGTVKDWRVVLIEPNIGIGLWDRLAIREQFSYTTNAGTPDWQAVGANARIVLGDLAEAADKYLAALRGMETR